MTAIDPVVVLREREATLVVDVLGCSNDCFAEASCDCTERRCIVAGGATTVIDRADVQMAEVVVEATEPSPAGSTDTNLWTDWLQPVSVDVDSIATTARRSGWSTLLLCSTRMLGREVVYRERSRLSGPALRRSASSHRHRRWDRGEWRIDQVAPPARRRVRRCTAWPRPAWDRTRRQARRSLAAAEDPGPRRRGRGRDRRDGASPTGI
jgi:hypothetical protein